MERSTRILAMRTAHIRMDYIPSTSQELFFPNRNYDSGPRIELSFRLLSGLRAQLLSASPSAAVLIMATMKYSELAFVVGIRPHSQWAQISKKPQATDNMILLMDIGNRCCREAWRASFRQAFSERISNFLPSTIWIIAMAADVS